jgi:hypothetical protein
MKFSRLPLRMEFYGLISEDGIFEDGPLRREF